MRRAAEPLLRPRRRRAAPDDASSPASSATATGSALITQGETRVICTASVERVRAALDDRPRHRLGHGRVRDAPGVDRPAQAARRHARAARTGAPSRSSGSSGARSARVVDFAALGERTIYLDCDVLQADGGTRCASITGAYVALELACAALIADGRLDRSPLNGSVAGDLVRDRRRRPAARPGLLRGLDRRGRRERRDDRRRRPRRGPGDGRAHAAVARAPRRAARAAPAASGGSTERAGQQATTALAAALRGSEAAMKLVLATPQRPQGARVRRAPGAARARAAPGRRRAAARDGRHVRGERDRQGARRGRGHRPARGGRRLGHRGGRARRPPGRALGALRRRGRRPTGRTSAKLLREAPAGSPLAYVCALAYAAPDGTEHVVVGRCTGTLAAEPRGDGGFGYDPVFVPDDIADGRTMAELAPGEKDAISHRGRAARAAGRRCSAQVDRRAGGDGQRQHGVAGVVAEEQQMAAITKHGDGRDPGDAAEGHDHIVADRLTIAPAEGA